MTVVTAAKKLWQLAPLLVPRGNRVAYIGANDLSNLGDRGMLEVHENLLADHAVVRFPTGTRNRLLRLYDGIYRRAPVKAVFLGGGTLVGRNGYLRRLRAFGESFPELAMFTLGVGVEDPAFGHARTDWEQLRGWGQILRRFEVVSVRGPRSRELLEVVGVESSVVGDPALMMALPAPARSVEGLIGLNSGYVTDLWGDDPGRLFSTLVEFGLSMAATGRQLRVFTTWDTDIDICRALTDEIGPAAQLVMPDSPRSLLDCVSSCEVVVGVKLHAVVFAAAAFVPTVMVDYRPKCSDFHSSIGMDSFTIRTDQVSAGWLGDAVYGLLAEREARVEEIKENVDRLRFAFKSTAESVRARISA